MAALGVGPAGLRGLEGVVAEAFRVPDLIDGNRDLPAAVAAEQSEFRAPPPRRRWRGCQNSREQRRSVAQAVAVVVSPVVTTGRPFVAVTSVPPGGPDAIVVYARGASEFALGELAS